MSQTQWGANLPDADRRDQLKLVYDYIKFHIGLYLGTPAALALIADGFGVKTQRWFVLGLIGAIVVYLASGIHAGLFMSRQVNDPWQADYLSKFEKEAFSSRRRFMHHTLYWVGLAIGLAGLAAALIQAPLGSSGAAGHAGERRNESGRPDSDTSRLQRVTPNEAMQRTRSAGR